MLVHQEHTATLDCSKCGRKFRKPGSHLKHEAHCQQTPSFTCSRCDARFPSQEQLRRHSKNHIGERFHCNICEKTFTHSNGFAQHKKSHIEERYIMIVFASSKFHLDHPSGFVARMMIVGKNSRPFTILRNTANSTRSQGNWIVTYVEGNSLGPGTWNATWWLTLVWDRSSATPVQRGSPAKKIWKHTGWVTQGRKVSNASSVRHPSRIFVDCNNTLTSTQRRLSLVKRDAAGGVFQQSTKQINLLLSLGGLWARPSRRRTWKNVGDQSLQPGWPRTILSFDATSVLLSSRITNEWKNT